MDLLRMSIPVLVAVDADESGRQAVERQLRQRYEPDYEVISVRGTEAGLAILSDLANTAREVLVVMAGSCMPGMTAAEFLACARRLHPAARCCLLIEWGDQPCPEATLRAEHVGEIDAVLPKPLQPLAEWFHHAIADYLAHCAAS
jgi:thioredoxin reductase (NADPH)